jgi:ribosomal protein S18 acetylase RimI-like enzyme
MAALHQFAREPSLVDLRRVAAWELDPLLLAETVEWEQRLDWDYSRSTDLVRKYTSTGSLAGAALVDAGTVVGYGYTVIEDHKGLIGDLYVQPELRGRRAEARLFAALTQELLNSPQVRRLESQLLLAERATALAARRDCGFRLHERALLTARAQAIRGTKSVSGFRIEGWGDHWNEAAATVITLAYRGHVDSEANDQYRTFGAASRFLRNLVEFPGCGVFFAPASLVAFDRSTGRASGIALCSFVSQRVGHITQLCVVPEARGRGLGEALLRAAAARLADAGAERVGLTVTLSNEAALRLYKHCGFSELRRFFAFAKDV